MTFKTFSISQSLSASLPAVIRDHDGILDDGRSTPPLAGNVSALKSRWEQTVQQHRCVLPLRGSEMDIEKFCVPSKLFVVHSTHFVVLSSKFVFVFVFVVDSSKFVFVFVFVVLLSKLVCVCVFVVHLKKFVFVFVYTQHSECVRPLRGSEMDIEDEFEFVVHSTHFVVHSSKFVFVDHSTKFVVHSTKFVVHSSKCVFVFVVYTT
ncbi:hypothetical protein DPMN_147605 [Dreissena polymorpha]|uniref:Uncharacterized protein n=1 Tax=Dreissena polymorpha TaxID=45954 RepID=A0A9D4J342_DREPO|nr:hypothetical protein DPMN_147605 [Dreissena polymorpha]